MTWRTLAPLAFAALASCGGSQSSPTYLEPRATPITCPPPTLVNGGTDLAPDPAGACVRAARDSALPAVDGSTPFGWTDLGTWQVGSVVPFTVPAGTASITLVEQEVASFLDVVSFTQAGVSSTIPNAPIPETLQDPNGRPIYSDYPATDPGLLVNGTFGAQAGVISYPNTSAALALVGTGGVNPGTWQVTVSDYGYECWRFTQSPSPQPELTCDAASRRTDGQYRLFLLTRPRTTVPGAPHAIPETGTLDVAVHIVDATSPVIGIAAADAPASATMQRFVQRYGGYLAEAGLCLGTVTFHDAPAWAQARFGPGVSTADPNPCGDVAQLLATSPPGGRTVDLFLVTRITDPATPQGTVLGIDGNIPGPASVNGTVVSGAVVSAEDLPVGSCGAATDLLNCGADEVGYLAAHESGHYLGLFHTSEADGASFDPLGDTPHCECSACGFSAATCSPAGTGVTVKACRQASPRCAGGLNLMFWLLDPSYSLGILSPEQGRVARASPLVRSP